MDSTGVATGTEVASGAAPVATGSCGAALFGERLTRWWVASTAPAVAGCVALVTAGSTQTATVRPAGVALAVLAGCCHALCTSSAKALLDHGLPVVPTVAVTLGLGAVLLPPCCCRGARSPATTSRC